MEVNIGAVLVATLAMFLVGGVWYGVLFAKPWGKIHGFDKLTKETQNELKAKTVPLYAVQAIVTFITAYVLALFIQAESQISPYELAVWLWLGFMMPTQVSAVAFGGTEGKYIAQKIGIMASSTLVCTLVGAWVLSLF